MPEELRAVVWPEVGSLDRLQKILEDFYRRASADVLIGFFFVGKDLQKLSRTQAAFLARAMGQADHYAGRSPGQAHLGLPPVLPGHFDRRIKVLDETLASHGLSPRAREAWIRFETLFRATIVTSRYQ